MLQKTFLLLTLLSSYYCAYTHACSCMMLTPEQRVKQSSNIFRGEILSSSATDNEVSYKVRVDQSCRIDKNLVNSDGTVKVTTAVNSAMCGVSGLTVGASYTFFANEQMKVGSCTWNGNADWSETEKLCKGGSTGSASGAGCVCNKMLAEVCGAVANGPKTTYGNACMAECAGAVVIHEGPCGGIVVDSALPPAPRPPTFPPRGPMPGNTGINPNAPPPGPAMPGNTGINPNAPPPRPFPGNTGINPNAPPPFFPNYPPRQAFMMTMKDVEQDVCNLCDRMRRSNTPFKGPIPTEPVTMPTGPVTKHPIYPGPGEVRPQPMPMPPVQAEENNCLCMALYAPVCSLNKDGVQQTYSNQCHAACAGATQLHDGECDSNNEMRTMDLNTLLKVDPVVSAPLRQ